MKVLIFLLSLVFLPHCAVADTLRLGIANYATQGLHGDLIDASVKELKKVLRPKNDLEFVIYTEEELEEAINNHQIDFFISSSAFYRRMIRKGARDLTSIETRKDDDPNQSEGAIVLVKGGRKDLLVLSDLKKQIVGYSPSFGPSSLQILNGEIKEKGHEPKTFFKKVLSLGPDIDKMLKTLDDGIIDALVLPSCILENFIENNEADSSWLRVLAPRHFCAARALDLTRSELLGALMRHYDGFCFERSATERVFAPWSLLNFFASPRNGLLDYWFESGGKPSVLMEYLKSHAMRSPEEYGREKTISLSTLSGSSDADTLSDLGLLTQTGYLTIKAVKYGDTVYLDYPNLEVKKAMGQLYVEHLLTGRSAGQVGAGPIVQVLSEESAEALVHILNRLFAAIDYQRYPVRDEASVRAFTQVYFAGAGLEPKVEHHTAHGRSDLEVKVNNRHWILEFKVSRDQENPDQKLEEAVEQLKLKGYGDDSSSENLIKVALVFSLEERKFIRWKEV